MKGRWNNIVVNIERIPMGKSYLKLPNPSTWSFRLNAAFTDTNRIIRLTTDIPAIGPTSHQTTDSYTDNQQLLGINTKWIIVLRMIGYTEKRILYFVAENHEYSHYRLISNRYFYIHTSIWKKVSIENPCDSRLYESFLQCTNIRCYPPKIFIFFWV